MNKNYQIDRRTFMTAFGAFCAVPTFRAFGETTAPLVRFGVVTDLHYADLNPVDNSGVLPVAGKVYYRESLTKLKKAVAVMNARTPDFMIELGDLKDNSGGRTKTLPYLPQEDASDSKDTWWMYRSARARAWASRRRRDDDVRGEGGRDAENTRGFPVSVTRNGKGEVE